MSRPLALLLHCSPSLVGGNPEIVLWHVLHQLLTGLLVLHNRKYSHHDIKPENIFLFHEITYDDYVKINKSADESDKENYRGKIYLKLGDFGQTQRDGSNGGAGPVDVMGGTYMYRPPEMIEGKSGSYPSDLFSVGVVMCVLVASHRACLPRTHMTPYHQVQARYRPSSFPATGVL